MSSATLPPGFRFHPTDEELVGYYLKRKVEGQKIELEVIPVIDLYKFDPWELPDKSFLPKRDMEWFFFCPRDRKYPNGSRTNRATASGYWKATGKDRKVNCEPSVTALRKTLVFYRGRAPGGQRTDWVMHEYRLYDDDSPGTCNFVGAFALCRVVKRNEHGLKTGETQEEARAKRVVSPTLDESNTENEVNIVSPKTTSMSAPNIASPSTVSASNNGGSTELPVFGLDSGHASFCGSNGLSRFPESLLLGDSIFTDLADPEEFTNPTATCTTSNISPVSSYELLTEHPFMANDIHENGCLQSFLNPTYFMGMYSNQDQITTQSNLWDSAAYMNQTVNVHEAWIPSLPPSICHQPSEEEFNFCLQEDIYIPVK